MRKGFIDQLIIEAKGCENIFLLTADLGYSFLEPFEKAFPDRFINVGVAEQNLISIAAGLALEGKKVFVYSIINFLTFRALEQIRCDICYHQLDVHLIGVGAGFSYRGAGYTHYGIEDIAIINTLATIEIFAPSTRAQVQEVVRSLAQKTTPSYVRLGKNEDPLIKNPSGLMEEVLQNGEEVVICCYGQICFEILKYIQPHHKLVVFCKIKPFDEKRFLDQIKGFRKIVIIEEHKKGGLSSMIALILHQYAPHAKASFFYLDDEVVSQKDQLQLPFILGNI